MKNNPTRKEGLNMTVIYLLILILQIVNLVMLVKIHRD
nr:MAG TPA: hypothetical protein [Caudoviricetes sp.]